MLRGKRSTTLSDDDDLSNRCFKSGGVHVDEQRLLEYRKHLTAIDTNKHIRVLPFGAEWIAFCHASFAVPLARLLADTKKKTNSKASRPLFIWSMMPSPGRIDQES